jgi:endothelin-converting enzyme/putative endopeptidase
VQGGHDTNATQSKVLQGIRDFLDEKADPCKDFYAYACGGFLQRYPIPPQEARWGTSDLMEERTKQVLLSVLDKLQSSRPESRSPGEQRVIDFFNACLHAGQPEQPAEQQNDPRAVTVDSRTSVLGANGFGRVLAALQNVSNATQLFAELGEIHRSVMDPEGNLPRPFFSYEVLPDGMHPEMMVLTLEQGGLGLPTRDYYVDESYSDILDAYPDHIRRMLTLSGVSEADAIRAASFIVEWETELAKASAPEADLGDNAWATYNPTNVSALQERIASAIPWMDYLPSLLSGSGKNAANVPLVIEWPPFFKRLNDMLATNVATNNISNLAMYSRWHVLNAMASVSGDSPIAAEHFHFFGQVVEGRKSPPDLRSECLALTDAHLGDDLGRLYVQRLFSDDVRRQAEHLIRNIEQEFGIILKHDDGSWLGAESLRAALEKLRLVQNNVGYPDRWPDYNTLHLNDSDLLGDVYACRQFRNDAILKQIGGARDRSLWDMTPITVNAYYDPLSNSMNIPAANFAPNFYSTWYPEAVNYGALGNVIGHELGHAFDSGGRHYDAEGRLSNWMTSRAVQEYDRRAKCMTDLYDHFRVNGKPVNGRLTLQENLADLTGMKTAHAAYQRLLRERMSSAARKREWDLVRKIHPDWTPEMLYFVAYAQTWCENETPTYAMEGLVVDVHAPNRYRVNGILSQFPAFAEAFRCRVGSPMRPRKVCALW